MSNSTHLRNRAFINQCRKSAKQLQLRGRKPSLEEIVTHALAQPAPAYYANFYNAVAKMKDYSVSPRGGRKYTSSTQWEHMAEDLRKLRSRNPGVNDKFLIAMLLAGKGGFPRFYMSHRRALQIVSEAGISF